MTTTSTMSSSDATCSSSSTSKSLASKSQPKSKSSFIFLAAIATAAIFGLLTLSFLAGAAISSSSTTHGRHRTKGVAAPPPVTSTTSSSSSISITQKDQPNNEICNSSIEESNRLWIYLDADDVTFTNDELEHLVQYHPLWSHLILSYHCLLHNRNENDDDEKKTTTSSSSSSYCIGVLRGGGNVILTTMRSNLVSSPRSSLLFYSACGIASHHDVDDGEGGTGTTTTTRDDQGDMNRFIQRAKDVLQSRNNATTTTTRTTSSSPILWSAEMRMFEFRNDDWSEWSNDPLRKDLGVMHLSKRMRRNVKFPIFAGKTPFQTFDVYDILHPKITTYESYVNSQQQQGKEEETRTLSSSSMSYEEQHPELYQPNRILFLDGVEQSTRRGLEAYHEALVQPGMFAHSNPRRVAIIGGGEGATLREVLKHDSVDRVTMIEIDEIMVEYSRVYLKEWNDCSDIEGSVDGGGGACFEDPRADMRYEDAMAWFLRRFSSSSVGAHKDEGEGSDYSSDDAEVDDDEDEIIMGEVDMVDPFDVIIMDALDPSDNVEFADVLYSNDAFFRALYDGLTEDGVLIIQQGETDHPLSVPPEYGEDRTRADVKRRLQSFGFVGFHEYLESHSGFEYPWLFLLACKSSKCTENYHANPANMDLLIRQRLRPTKSGKPPLSCIDGSTLGSYQVPKRVLEQVYCRSRKYQPSDCNLGRGMDSNMPYYRAGDAFELVMDEGDGRRRGRFVAKVDLPKLSYLEAGVPLQLEPSTLDHLTYSNFVGNDTSSSADAILKLVAESNSIAGPDVKGLKHVGTGLLPAGLSALRAAARGALENDNDECINNETRRANVGTLTSLMIADGLCQRSSMWFSPPSVGEEEWECHLPHNPVVARHVSAYGGGVLLTLRDIAAGEEIILDF